jgi:hypothetical protein
MVTPYLSNPALKEEACQAAVGIAEALKPPYAPAVKEALREVAKTTGNQRLRKTAHKLLPETKK